MLRAFEEFTLGWVPAWIVAAVLLAVGILGARSSAPRRAWSGAFVRETGVVFALYGLWMFLGAHTGTRQFVAAQDRAQGILDAERFLHIDVEAWLQRGILGQHWLVQSANVFYATVHFPAMVALLIWAFVRHRDRYAGVRVRVVLVTLSCLLIQLVAVAPPRLLSTSGLVDTPARYGQSVYDSGFVQLSAMPSVHLAWATLVAWEVLRCSRSRARLLAPALPVLTLWVVMVTGNHWLLDGVAGAAIVGATEVAIVPWDRARARARCAARADAPGRVGVGEPVGELVR